MEKIKEFLQTKTGQHVYSFVKTYLTVFLGIVVFADASGTDIFTATFIASALKASTISIIRTAYKLLTE